MKLSSKRWTTTKLVAHVVTATAMTVCAQSANASDNQEQSLLNAAKASYNKSSSARKIANPFAVKKWKGVFLTFADSKTATRSKAGVSYNHEARWVFRFDMNFSNLQVIGGNLFDYKGETKLSAFFEDRMYNAYPNNSSRTIARRVGATTLARKGAALLRMNRKENHFRFASDSSGSGVLDIDMTLSMPNRADEIVRERKTVDFQRFDFRYPSMSAYFPSTMLKSPYSMTSTDLSVPQPDTSKMSMPEVSAAITRWMKQTEAARLKHFARAGRPVPLRGRGTTEMSFDFGERTPHSKITVYWVFEISPA